MLVRLTNHSWWHGNAGAHITFLKVPLPFVGSKAFCCTCRLISRLFLHLGNLADALFPCFSTPSPSKTTPRTFFRTCFFASRFVLLVSLAVLGGWSAQMSTKLLTIGKEVTR